MSGPTADKHSRDLYLVLTQFEKTCWILKVKQASYLKYNHFSLLCKNAIRLLNLFITHEWTDMYSTTNTTLTATMVLQLS